MTEKEFMQQVWRPFDVITTSDGIRGNVMNVSFNTRSVRAYIGKAPEWIRCELIETHTSAKGGDASEVALVQELQAKVAAQAEHITQQQVKIKELEEKISRNYQGDLLRAVNIMQQGLQEKKNKLEKVDSGLQLILDTIEKINRGE